MNTCPQCGSAALAEAMAGQCPRCLLEMASRADEGGGDSCFNPARRQVGDYLLKRPVGAGGMGVVYEAYRQADGCQVAIKVIRDSHLASPVQLRRFTLEAEAAARLDHPNIVRIHEIGDDHGSPFLSMDFVEGESLAAQLSRGDFTLNPAAGVSAEARSPRLTDIARLMAKIARAVQHAHVRGVLHRDLKPGNILIDPHGRPHLTDFGLAKILQPDAEEARPHTLTSSADLAGTPSYMSPEQVSNKAVCRASDIYGLGAVLYALLTGRPPFLGPTPMDVFRQIMEHPPARPRSLNPSIHADLEIICLKCLEKDPLHRYRSAEVLAEDLERFAAGGPIQARRPGPIHRAQQWVKRNRLATALITSLCFGVSAALGLLKLVNDQREAVELDRDEAFDEGMQKISQIWSDPRTMSVTISARELAILAGSSPSGLARARFQLTLGVRANDGPSSMAQRYARLLGGFQRQMERTLDGKVAFHLRLLKRFNQNADTLARGEVDFIVLSGVDFLRAEQAAPGVVPIAWARPPHDGVIVARTNSGCGCLADLRGRSVAFPDPNSQLTIWAKARLRAAGLGSRDLRSRPNTADSNGDTGHPGVGAQALAQVLRGEADAAVIRRPQFERSRHLGLVAIEHFPMTPNCIAARAGLDPGLIHALRTAIRSLDTSPAWPEDRFQAEHSSEDSPASSILDALRHALDEAERFDQATQH